MTNLATKIGIGLIPVFLLTACESAEDAARKPALVDEIVENSLARCDLQEEFSQKASYEIRLQEALMDAPSDALDFIIDNEITACLDRRLAETEPSWGRGADALYYPESKTYTLYDNGIDNEHQSFMGRSTDSYSGSLLNRFEKHYDDGELNRTDGLQFGYRYSTGKTTGYRWKDNGEEYDHIIDNPELLTPPLAGNDI